VGNHRNVRQPTAPSHNRRCSESVLNLSQIVKYYQELQYYIGSSGRLGQIDQSGHLRIICFLESESYLYFTSFVTVQVALIFLDWAGSFAPPAHQRYDM
jgi:hypothetical protein